MEAEVTMASPATFSNHDDTIDSMDVIDRLDELRDLFEEEGRLDDEDRAELESLERLCKECELYAEDWEHGVTLIRDSHFSSYIKELIEECGDLPKKLPWAIVINWDATVDNYRSDYTPVDFGGVTYWVR